MLAPTITQPVVTAVKTAAAPASPAVDAVSSSISWFLTWPSEWPGLHHVLSSCQQMSQGTATILIIAGLGFLAYGQTAHRLCMSLNCAILGTWIGGMLGKQGNAVIPGMLIGGFLGGLMAWPLLNVSIKLVSAGAGFVVGCCVWRTFPNLAPQYAWAGGAIGLVFLFMLSHVTMRWAVILSTGFQGAAMLIMGILGWLYQISSIKPSIDNALGNNHYIMPLAILIPTIFGLIYQQSYGSAPAAAAPAKK